VRHLEKLPLGRVDLPVAQLFHDSAVASPNVKDTASAAVKDSYTALVTGTRRVLARRKPHADLEALDDPEELAAALTAAGLEVQDDVVDEARRLLSLVGPKYSVEVHDSTGVQIGDHNTMHVTG
jgi:hypothetical protein